MIEVGENIIWPAISKNMTPFVSLNPRKLHSQLEKKTQLFLTMNNNNEKKNLTVDYSAGDQVFFLLLLHGNLLQVWEGGMKDIVQYEQHHKERERERKKEPG